MSGLEAIQAAYYQQVLQEGMAARGRAQNGYSIAAAVAGAITAAGVFAKLTVDDAALVVVGGLAIAAWIVAALIYLWAISGAPPKPFQTAADTAEAFIDEVIRLARKDRDDVQGRIRVANVAAVVATLLSTAAIGIGLARTGAEERGTIVLTPEGQAAISTLCHSAAPSLRVRVKTADLTAERVPVHVLSGCADRSIEELVIDRDSIAVLRKDR